MSGEHSPRLSLAESAADVAALRDGTHTPRSLIHVAQAAEHALRRMLRDDPTAPVDLRLQALAPEELSLDGLLAELRRHERISMELAAGMHELAGAAARVEAGAPVEARDAANAVTVAETLEAQLQKRPAVATLEDPLRSPEPDVSLDDDEPVVHAVPPAGPPVPLRWIGTLLGVIALVALVGWLALRTNRGGGLRQADELLDRGRSADAAAVLRDLAAKRPDDPRAAARLARIYREAGRPTDALLALRAGLSGSPADPRLNEELGAQLLEQHQPREAVRAYGAAVKADSTSQRAWVGLVRALRENGDVAGAQRALALAPEPARILVGPTPPQAVAPMDTFAPQAAQP